MRRQESTPSGSDLPDGTVRPSPAPSDGFITLFRICSSEHTAAMRPSRESRVEFSLSLRNLGQDSLIC
jgi:hypothetical protein